MKRGLQIILAVLSLIPLVVSILGVSRGLALWLPEACEEAIARLASEQLEQLTLLVLELEAIAALEQWLTEAVRSQIVNQLSEKLNSTPDELEIAVSKLSLQKLLMVKVQEVSSINELEQV